MDVQSRDKEFNDGSNENRTTVFDLYCIDSVQRRFIIEVQQISESARNFAGQGALRSQEHEKLDADAQAVCQYGV